MKLLKIFRKRQMIQFSGRSHTRIGILSAVIGIAVVIGFITISLISGLKHGDGGMVLGIIGIFLFALAVFGFYLSYKAIKQRDIFYRFPTIGIILNGIMTIVFFMIYIIGIGL